MKLNKIMLFFFISLPISLGLRFLQLNFTIDATTGFYLKESVAFGKLILAAIFVCVIASGIFASFTYHQIENPPKTNILLSLISFLLTVAVIGEGVLSPSFTTAPIWQAMLFQITSIACGIYFFLFAIFGFLKIKLPEIASTIPAIYIIACAICNFTSISKLALISDHILIIATYCTLMFFMLNFAKLYNKTDLEKNTKKLFGFGLPAVILCFTNSIPNISLYFLTDEKYSHTSILCNISLLIFGVFILVFLFSIYKDHLKTKQTH